MSGCKGKHLYSTKKMADDYAHFYNRDIYRDKDDQLDYYYCTIHKSWHVGHIKLWKDLSPVERVNKILDGGKN